MKKYILAGVTTLALAVAGCGGSGLSPCAKWKIKATAFEQQNWRNAKAYAKQFVRTLPAANQPWHSLAETTYNATIENAPKVLITTHPKGCAQPVFIFPSS